MEALTSIEKKIQDLISEEVRERIRFIVHSRLSSIESLIVSYSGRGDWFEVPVSTIKDILKVGYSVVESNLYPIVEISFKKENELFFEDLIRYKFSTESESNDFFFQPSASLLEATISDVKELSGIQWVNRFPGSRDISTLVSPFKENFRNFHNSLLEAHATVSINATMRPKERAFLMKSSFQISRKLKKPEEIQELEGLNINWVHDTPSKSIAAATDMVNGYGIVFQPAFPTRHSLGLAVDMTVRWSGTLDIKQANGTVKSITSTPKDNTNTDLAAVARTFNVIKHPTDKPHWSDNGN